MNNFFAMLFGIVVILAIVATLAGVYGFAQSTGGNSVQNVITGTQNYASR